MSFNLNSHKHECKMDHGLKYKMSNYTAFGKHNIGENLQDVGVEKNS